MSNNNEVGIKIEDCKEINIKDCKIHGYSTGIDVKNSGDIRIESTDVIIPQEDANKIIDEVLIKLRNELSREGCTHKNTTPKVLLDFLLNTLSNIASDVIVKSTRL